MVNENHLSRYNTMQNQHLHNAFVAKLINSTKIGMVMVTVMTNENDNDDFPYSKFPTIWIKSLCVTKYSLFHKTNTLFLCSMALAHTQREVCFLFSYGVHD